MPLVLLRVWLPDRPGALGQVASRIGALRGDVVGIDILERGGGRVVDELVVELPRGVPDDLLVREVRQVDGVDVEEVRDLDEGSVPDPRTDALDDATALVEASDPIELLDELTARTRSTFAADWALVVDHDVPRIRSAAGHALPPAPWLAAFSRGVWGQEPAGAAVAAVAAGDLVCVPMPAAPEALVVCRSGRAFRARERRQLTALATIAAARLTDLEGAVAEIRPLLPRARP